MEGFQHNLLKSQLLAIVRLLLKKLVKLNDEKKMKIREKTEYHHQANHRTSLCTREEFKSRICYMMLKILIRG